jgi:chemotaxis protein methyltransferase CheR
MAQLNPADRSTAASESFREFSMSMDNFEFIRTLAYSLTGISLSDHKQNMIYGRLARRLRQLSLDNFDQYCALLAEDDSPELDEFVNSITTNLTAFFREQHHFDFLKTTLLPDLIQRNNVAKRLRIWSAGCSTGEEPYSIAMVLKSCTALSRWDVKVLATDLDSNVVAAAQEGLYTMDRANSVPAEYRKYVLQEKASQRVKIKDEVKSLITFKQLNLLHEWPIKGPFDVIFCRNVVIYFDAQTQMKLFDRYANILTSNGHLFIGHSESLHKISDRFESLGRTIYRRSR